jgi:hypothetical protein
VALMNSIMGFNSGAPMNFIQPVMPPALTANPEIAKAAQYGGGGGAVQAPAAGGATTPNGQQAQPSSGSMPEGGAGGMLGSIGKLFGSDPQTLQALMAMFGG